MKDREKDEENNTKNNDDNSGENTSKIKKWTEDLKILREEYLLLSLKKQKLNFFSQELCDEAAILSKREWVLIREIKEIEKNIEAWTGEPIDD